MQFDTILINYEIDPSVLFNRLNQWESDTLEFTDSEMLSLPISVVEQAVASGNDLGRKICYLINEYLNAITQEQWTTNLKNDSQVVQLYLTFKPANYQTLVDAVFDIIKTNIKDGKGSIPIPSLQKILEKMVDANEPLENELKKVVDYIGLGHGTSASIFKALAPWVFKQTPQSLNNGANFEQFIPSNILSDGNVISILKENQSILLRCRKPESFKSKLRQMAETTHKNDSEFMNFVRALGVLKGKKDKS